MPHPDLLFPPDAGTRAIARRLYGEVANLPIISPHGHTDPGWFARDEAFPDPAQLFIVPDHYIFRMLYSRGVPLEQLGVPRRDGGPTETDSRAIWRLLAANWRLFRATPSRLWFEHSLATLFGIEETLTEANADALYDRIADALSLEAYRPRALYVRFGLEVLATTDSPFDTLDSHKLLRREFNTGRIIPTFRPDPVTDPDFDGFADNVARLGAITGEDTTHWPAYLAALAKRRQDFKALGATATDHGHPSAATADLSPEAASRLFGEVLAGDRADGRAERFRAQMLTEMARMSLEDGLVMQLHPGSRRNHNPSVMARFGRDKGADIPGPTDYVEGLRPLLDRFGNEAGLTVILFTLDEAAYSRELAPLAGHYPALRLGPPWWFFDSPEGIKRFRETVTETAGFYNTVGFNDDTRAFCSIPARHDIARRADCAYLAGLVADHRMGEDDALDTATDLAYRLAREAYRL